MSSGRLFQTLGAATLYAVSAADANGYCQLSTSFGWEGKGRYGSFH